MAAEAKRLSPTRDTIRNLFGKCGNQCAFPECKHEIIDADGVFVAEICHIEAAKTGGPRFNPNMTNDERRHVSNLLLMCHKHHKITDNVNKYPTRVLIDMKEMHEAKYLDAARKIWESIKDHTDSDEISPPTTLSRFFEIDEVPAKDKKYVRKAFRKLATMLKPVPIPSREILLHSVRRASRPDYYDPSMQVIAEEVAQACNMSTRSLWVSVRILARHNLVRIDDENHSVYILSLIGILDDWNIWNALRSYCKETKIDLQAILVDLKFNLLD